ncbi:hypothetical protein C1646_772361 [Rhizophagus diaphanus]|nr:hypothetical protein C1646_772361 [Rhizophagus diaphanus] [Rhizophagus sp. MUCL 43196]
MSKIAKNHDKEIQQDSTSQETKDAWLQLEQTTLNSQALVLDALSFGNEIRKEQALRSISPGYQKQSEREEVFGEELPGIICKENETNKLFNNAAWRNTRLIIGKPVKRRLSKPPEFSLTTSIDMVAGGLGLHQDQWSDMFGECWATFIVREGYIPEWSLTSPLKRTPIFQRRYENTDLNIFSHEISELLKIKAIQEMDPEKPCFVSNFFIVPKKDGRDRPCEITSAM